MGFTTSCFIRKSSPELLEGLRELGYDGLALPIEEICHNGGILAYHCTGTFGIVTFGSYAAFHKSSSVDCGTNEDLFLAIAALRDDTDKGQWFVVDRKMQGFEVGDFFLSRFDRQHPSISHKATLDELMRHFNKK